MRRMKDSGVPWIGEIPEGWEIKRLKSICTINPRVNIDNINLETEVSFLPMENIKYGYLVDTIIKNFSEYCLSYNIFNDGDILLAKVTPCFENGNIAIANNLKNCIGFGTSEIFVVRISNTYNTDNRFLFYYFRNELFRQRAIATMSGTGGLKRISPQFMRDEKILFPPFPEQQHIASYLDAKCTEIDRSMELVRQSMDKLKAYKMSVITEAVTKGLDPDVPMKDSGVPWIGQIPIAWKCMPLKRLVTNVKTGSTPKGAEEKYYAEDGLKWFTPADFITFPYIDNSIKKLSDLGAKEVKTFPQNSVLLIGIGATMGKVALVRCQCSANQQINCIQCKNDLLPLFLTFHLATITDYLFKCGKFNTLPILNQEETKDIYIPLPPLSEQHRIASYLDTKCAEIDAIIAQKQELLDKLATYKKSLIFECVTGKREVAA
ncbi:restriction endonuclease subunit S [uncultured Desulfovibrio sp.]|uniref:restriction endonuclease subunit S n=2 Tax=uncultured Desulfovibrio sp. TaxID=167968 RepID=UPI002634BC4B|nr:restriction endonuclease subunit S [uncultured Desulfovibrio sp.]